MTKSIPQVKIVDLATGEEIVRDANAAEIDQIQADATSYATKQAEAEAELASKRAEAEAKATAKAALLERLGITQDEAKLLLS